jgi:hypothetical protein
MNHSPAPWNIERNANGELALWDANDRHLLDSVSPLPLATRRANAQLMRASPALLAACHTALEALTPARNAEEQAAAVEIQAALDITLQPIPGEDWDADDEEEA